MSRKKSTAAKIFDAFKSAPEGETPGDMIAAERPTKAERPWWSKLTLKEFKAAITTLDETECVVLLETIRQAIREVTLRQHVEDMSADEAKAAGRIAPVYRGCAEALLTKIHAFEKPNKPLER